MELVNIYDNSCLKYYIQRKPIEKLSPSILEEVKGVVDNGYLYVDRVFEPVKLEGYVKIWSTSQEPENTYKAYIYSFEHIGWLLSLYDKYNDNKYLYISLCLIKGYIEWYKEKGKNEFVWRDMNNAYRVINIIAFIMKSKEARMQLSDEDKKIIIELLFQHIPYLLDDSIYLNNNHGLMVDQALVSVAIFMNKTYKKSKELYMKVMKRIKFNFECNFSNDSLNTENSPFYHQMNMSMFEEIVCFLKNNNIDENFGIDKRIEEIKKVFGILIKDNNELPLIGDTEQARYSGYEYVNEDRVFEEGKLAIFKNLNYYFSFKYGFKTLSHKHYDELSFTYRYKGIDIFLDGGKLNYNSRDERRTILHSVKSHNCINVNNENYRINLKGIEVDNETYNLCTLKEKYISNNIKYIRASSKLYKDVELLRAIAVINDNMIVIHDKYKANKDININQNFLINNEFKVKKLRVNHVELEGKSLKLNISQLNDIHDIEYNNGNYKETKGVYSPKWNMIQECNNISFVNKSINGEYITLILINDIKGNTIELDENKKLDENRNMLIIKDNNKKYFITLNKEKHFIEKYFLYNGITYVINESALIIRLDIEYEGNLEFCIYVYKDNVVYKKYYYQKELEFKIEYCERGLYKTVVFVRNNNNNNDKVIFNDETSFLVK